MTQPEINKHEITINRILFTVMSILMIILILLVSHKAKSDMEKCKLETLRQAEVMLYEHLTKSEYPFSKEGLTPFKFVDEG